MRSLAPAALALLLAGCSPVYVYKSWRGHARLLSARRPVAQVLADPGVPARLKDRLRLASEIRAFAVERIGLPGTKNYTAFVELPGPHVTHIVTAARRTRLEAHEWWFPVVGRVPYKGYFDRDDALREERRLRRRGLDTYVAGVRAYSTLGWTADPLLSSMLEYSTGTLARLLIHEMTHPAVYFNGRADFNEALATFVGEEGARDFLRERFGEDSPEWRADARLLERERDFDAAMERLHGELERLYASDAPEQEKLARREELFARARPELGLEADEPLNNAVVLAHRRYRHSLEDFSAAHERLGRSWPKTLALLRGLDRRRPREALRAWLSSNPLSRERSERERDGVRAISAPSSPHPGPLP